jgi:hypothetical protein
MVEWTYLRVHEGSVYFKMWEKMTRSPVRTLEILFSWNRAPSRKGALPGIPTLTIVHTRKPRLVLMFVMKFARSLPCVFDYERVCVYVCVLMYVRFRSTGVIGV